MPEPKLELVMSGDEAAKALSDIWEEYRLSVCKQQDFETRLENARVNQAMGRAVHAACVALRQGHKDIADCEAQVRSLRNTVCKLQAE